jgi:hypothetical protein
MANALVDLLDLLLWRDGGQRRSRRNAWAAMVGDSARARQRAEVEAAVGQLLTEPVVAREG